MNLHPNRFGSRHYYDKGCRCAECREASRGHRKRMRDLARSEGRSSYERELAASRAYKKTQVGTCEGCGVPTTYNGHTVAGASRLCHACAAKEEGLKMRGTGPLERRALAFLATPRRMSELRDHLGISNGHVSALLYQRLVPYGLVKRVSRGIYVKV